MDKLFAEDMNVGQKGHNDLVSWEVVEDQDHIKGIRFNYTIPTVTISAFVHHSFENDPNLIIAVYADKDDEKGLIVSGNIGKQGDVWVPMQDNVGRMHRPRNALARSFGSYVFVYRPQ